MYQLIKDTVLWFHGWHKITRTMEGIHQHPNVTLLLILHTYAPTMGDPVVPVGSLLPDDLFCTGLSPATNPKQRCRILGCCSFTDVRKVRASSQDSQWVLIPMNQLFFMTYSALHSPLTVWCCCWKDSFSVEANRNGEVVETLDDLCFINVSLSITDQQN